MAVSLINERAMNRKLSRLPGVRAAVRSATDELGARATANLSANRDTGNARIEIERDGVDGIVSLVDPAGNALAIRVRRAYNVRAQKYVDGQYPLTSAVREMENE